MHCTEECQRGYVTHRHTAGRQHHLSLQRIRQCRRRRGSSSVLRQSRGLTHHQTPSRFCLPVAVHELWQSLPSYHRLDRPHPQFIIVDPLAVSSCYHASAFSDSYFHTCKSSVLAAHTSVSSSSLSSRICSSVSPSVTRPDASPNTLPVLFARRRSRTVGSRCHHIIAWIGLILYLLS